MKITTRLKATKSDELPLDLRSLISAVAELPAEHRTEVEGLLSKVTESTRRRRRILQLVQDALSQLRLDMKYLVFDLEATRRERDEYRAALENDGYDG